VKDLTLYKIDTELEQLLEYRQARVEDLLEPPAPEEIAALDDEIQRYMQTLAKKVDGTAALLLAWRAQRETITAERARLKTLLDRIEARDARLREYVTLALSRQPAPSHGVRRLRGATTELLLRTAGGLAPLVIQQPELVPHDLETIELTLRYDCWEELLRHAPAELKNCIEADAKQKVLPSNTLIREELKKPCTACGGIGSVNGIGCTECDGSGRRKVPGAYLDERGTWIEVR